VPFNYLNIMLFWFEGITLMNRTKAKLFCLGRRENEWVYGIVWWSLFTWLED